MNTDPGGGLRSPQLADGGGGWGALLVPMLFGAGLGMAALALMIWLSPPLRAFYARRLQEFGPLAPVTQRERWQWVGVAITAGVCEEFLFRGLSARRPDQRIETRYSRSQASAWIR